MSKKKYYNSLFPYDIAQNQYQLNQDVTDLTKENSKYDYTKRSAVKLESNEIMRLNPDVTAYPRSINILLSKPNTDVIAFEVNELEANNLVLNLKFLNGKNYFSYNIITQISHKL